MIRATNANRIWFYLHSVPPAALPEPKRATHDTPCCVDGLWLQSSVRDVLLRSASRNTGTQLMPIQYSCARCSLRPFSGLLSPLNNQDLSMFALLHASGVCVGQKSLPVGQKLNVTHFLSVYRSDNAVAFIYTCNTFSEQFYISPNSSSLLFIVDSHRPARTTFNFRFCKQ